MPLRTFSNLATVFLLALLAAPSLSAQVSTKGHALVKPEDVAEGFLPPAPPETLETVVLRPDQRSHVVLPEFRLDKLADGTRSVRGVSIAQQGEFEEFFFFEVDPEQGTYRTYSAEDRGEDGLRELARLRGKAAENQRAIECTCEEEPCSGSWSATVTTYDPIYLPLTETYGYSD